MASYDNDYIDVNRADVQERNEERQIVDDGPKRPSPIDGFPDFGHIRLQKVNNARDLGGLPTESGKRIAKRRLLRSGDLHEATDADISQLIDMHDLAYVADLRSDDEVEGEPDPIDRMPGVEYEHLEILEDASIVSIKKLDLHDIKVGHKYLSEPVETIKQLYLKALQGVPGIQGYSKLIDDLLKRDEGATLWHCTQGKDRTGVAAILIEHILGVPMELIRRDYLATNLFMDGWISKVGAFLRNIPFAKDLESDIDAYTYAQPIYFDAAMRALEEGFGSIDLYIEGTLGIDFDKKVKLREMYLE